ncbi:O-antigen ligase family protein [Halocatena halophila]|uniref:O-antigen ligase family protein n=1 Tax=Halocatena halophila TaxID=2814576 RepID=UPI002ED14A1D
MIVYFSGEWIQGLIAGIIVLSTVSADVPLLGIGGRFPGDVVGDLVLVYVPIVVLCAGCIYRDVSFRPSTRGSWLFCGFFLWTVLSALVSNGPSRAVALWFSAHVGLGLLVFLLLEMSVRERWVRFRSVVLVLLVAVGGQTVVGLTQFLTQGTFGLSQLGEGGDATVSVIAIGSISFEAGTFVSGFTGMSFNLANLLVLTLPVWIVVLFRSTRRLRSLMVGGWIVVSCVVLRATSTDAGRGALFVGAGCLLVVLLVSSGVPRTLATMGYNRTQRLLSLCALLGGLLTSMLPSSTTNSISVHGAAVNGGSTNSAVTNAQQAGGDSILVKYIISGADRLSQVSIPLFDLSNLGIRFQQYLAGLRIFVDHPLLGIGGMNYVAVADQYGVVQPAQYATPLPIHNIYILLLAETGIVGLILFFGTLGYVCVYGFRLAWQFDADRLYVMATLAGLIGTLAFGFWDVLQLYYATGFFPMWIVAGAIAGKYDRVLTQSIQACAR